MSNRTFKSSPYRPFTSFLPYDLKNVRVTRDNNGQGYFDPINEKLDLQWGGSRSDQAFNNYYDYFFSGEDTKVYIDGLFDEQDELDTASLAFVIKQEKQPLYGFWSYNYDAMMLGTRLITGELSVYTRYPRRMTDLLEKAASVRLESSSANPSVTSVISTLGSDYATQDDEINIQKYWLNTDLDRSTVDPASRTLSGAQDASHNIFSAHPPFNIIIFYGLEELATSTHGAPGQVSSDQRNQQSNSDRIMATDYNERKVLQSVSQPMKVVLQNVHLMSMTSAYQSGGQALVENYQFIARDMYFTDARVGVDKPLMGMRSTVPDKTEAQFTAEAAVVETITSGISFDGIGTL
jgi:hypothetical protein